MFAEAWLAINSAVSASSAFPSTAHRSSIESDRMATIHQRHAPPHAHLVHVTVAFTRPERMGHFQPKICLRARCATRCSGLLAAGIDPTTGNRFHVRSAYINRATFVRASPRRGGFLQEEMNKQKQTKGTEKTRSLPPFPLLPSVQSDRATPCDFAFRSSEEHRQRADC